MRLPILFPATTLAFAIGACFPQSISEMMALRVPRELALSAAGDRLQFKLGSEFWEIATTPGARPLRTKQRPALSRPPARRPSPDLSKTAFLQSPNPASASLLFCQCAAGTTTEQQLSPLPIRDFQWAAGSDSLWVLVSNGPDVALGRLLLNGHFEQLTAGAALRGTGGLVAANDVVAWIQSDPSQHGAIWIKDKAGKIFPLWDPNPQTTRWSQSWTQEVVHWKNPQGELLHGILARPRGRRPAPLIVDPYSGWHNRFLGIPVLGNYAFVKAGFAVFFPNHRAPHAFPAVSFGPAYLAPSSTLDPVTLLTNDVVSGVEELIRRGDVDPDRLFLYSFSTGASAIGQLLTQTRCFRAAVSFAGVADWLQYYRDNQPRGDNTIPNFLGGRRLEDSPGLYDRISPAKHAGLIHTPLRLVIGDNDSLPGGASRYRDTLAFYDALRQAGRNVELQIHRGQGHGLDSAALSERHVRQSIEFFLAHMPAQTQ